MGAEGLIAEIAVPVPVPRTFHYRVPARLDAQVVPGVRVQVLFGPRWMTPQAEARLFEPWDDIYREVSKLRRETGIEPTPRLDSRDLQNDNVISALRLDHDVARRLRLHHSQA